MSDSLKEGFKKLRNRGHNRKEQQQIQDEAKKRRDKAQIEARQTSRDLMSTNVEQSRYAPQSVKYSNDLPSGVQASYDPRSSLPTQAIYDSQTEQKPPRPPKDPEPGHPVPDSVSLVTGPYPTRPLQHSQASNSHGGNFDHLLTPRLDAVSIKQVSPTSSPIPRKQVGQLLDRSQPVRDSSDKPIGLPNSSRESDLSNEKSISDWITIKTKTNFSYRDTSHTGGTKPDPLTENLTSNDGSQKSQAHSLASDARYNIPLGGLTRNSYHLHIAYDDHNKDDTLSAEQSTPSAIAALDTEIKPVDGDGMATQQQIVSQLPDPSLTQDKSQDGSVSPMGGPSPLPEQVATSQEPTKALIDLEHERVHVDQVTQLHDTGDAPERPQSRLSTTIEEASIQAQADEQALELAQDAIKTLQNQLALSEARRTTFENSLVELDLGFKAVNLDRNSFQAHVIASKQEMDAANSEIHYLRGLQAGYLQQITQLASKEKDLETKLNHLRQIQIEDRTRIADLEQQLENAKHHAQYIHNNLTESHQHAMYNRDENWRRTIAKIKEAHINELRTSQQQINTDYHDHLHKINHLKQAKATEIQQLMIAHSGEIEKMRQDNETEINRVKYGKNSEISNLKQTHNTAIKTLQDQVATAAAKAIELRQELINAHRESTNKLKSDHAAKLSIKEAELGEERQSTQIRLNSLLRAHEVELAEKDHQYKQSTQNLREEVEGLRMALLTNDDDMYRGELFTTSGLPTKSDDKIYNQFLTVIQLVDTIGRLKWRQAPLIWTNERVQRIRGSQTDRSVKRLIVLDFVWSLLYRYIFSSPFRIFHEEGKSLEEQWSHACGQDLAPEDEPYKWPLPSSKTERWRYMTINACREALRPPVPSDLDPRSRLRKGFVQSLEDFVSEAQVSLSNVIDLSDTDINVIEKLASKAATIWLEFAAHRFRIIIGLKGSSEIVSMQAKAQSKSAELTEAPTLGRYGDASGTDLETYTTIGDCVGKSVALST